MARILLACAALLTVASLALAARPPSDARHQQLRPFTSMLPSWASWPFKNSGSASGLGDLADSHDGEHARDRTCIDPLSTSATCVMMMHWQGVYRPPQHLSLSIRITST